MYSNNIHKQKNVNQTDVLCTRAFALISLMEILCAKGKDSTPPTDEYIR